MTSSNVATFGVGVVQVVATGIATWLVDKAGRRLLLMISSIGMTISLVIVAVAFYLKEFVSPDSNMYNILSMVSVVGVVVSRLFYTFTQRKILSYLHISRYVY